MELAEQGGVAPMLDRQAPETQAGTKVLDGCGGCA
jgi:hypothetical protein